MKRLNDLESINNRLKLYLAKLLEKEPMFLENLRVFNEMSVGFLNLCDDTIFLDDKSVEDFENCRDFICKESPSVTLELVKKYFSEMYGGIYDAQIERAIVDGTINLLSTEEDEVNFNKTENKKKIDALRFEIEELEKESKVLDLSLENYKYKKELLLKNIIDRENQIRLIECAPFDLEGGSFSYGSFGRILNSPFYGNITDGTRLIHEIRHLLNLSDSNIRSFLSQITTEGLSYFDSLNYLDFLEGLYSNNDLNFVRKKIIYSIYQSLKVFNWESLLVTIFDDYGKVTTKNYLDFSGEEDSEVFEYLIKSRGFIGNLENGKRYSLGTIVGLYLHYKVRENPEFISKIVELNSDLLKNPTIIDSEQIPEFFESIELDINDDEQIEESIKSELEWIAYKYDSKELI